MPTDVIMPQMGESIAEGTIVRWCKKIGEKVEKDEILFEISTDKVDAEIPSPSAGFLSEILAVDGETVAVDSVVARLSTQGEVGAPAPAEGAPPPTAPGQAPASPQAEVQAAAPGSRLEPEGSVPSREELRRTRSSPLVRKMAREAGVDLTRLTGTGLSGRVTRADLVAYLEAPAPAPGAEAARGATPEPGRASTPRALPEGGGRVEPFSPMRRAIAEHMVHSRETSVHVTTVFEVDMTRVDRLRRRARADYAARGLSLTFTPFVMKALTQALIEHPRLNASVEEGAIRYHPTVNLGLAVALDWGLIVPVIRSAEDLSLAGLSRAVKDLADRARAKKLSPEEVQGGTFTLTNPGIFGSLFGTPIINQPQVAILGMGAVQKRVVVIDPEEETLGVRSMACLALSFDHRVIDGADADRFMARVKTLLQEFPEEAL